MINIKGVILDYGNVISHPQKERDINAMARALRLGREEFDRGYWHRRLDYDRKLSASDYWHSVLEESGRKPTSEQIAEVTQLDCESWSHANPLMLKWIDILRNAGISVALLSNMPEPIANHLEERCSWFPRFAQTTFSCRVGYTKPQKEIYQHCLQESGMQPATTLFLDDRLDNMQAAEKLGINSVLFTEAKSIFKILSERFDLPLP